MLEFLWKKLDGIEGQYGRLEERLAQPEVWNNRELMEKLGREHAELKEIVDSYRSYKKLYKAHQENEQQLQDEIDEDLCDMYRDELEQQNHKLENLETKLQLLLLPNDPNDERDVYLEIRAGTGGDEAALFAADLLRMYMHYAERKGWKTEFISIHETGLRGYKEVIVQIQGQKVYSRLKYESGVHRVQRVPTTETQGRIHTSAATVAVLPEARDADVYIDEKDLKIDRFRSSGPGGQSVNTTDSAIRITHLPTGLVVTCQDEKSQHKNKAKALSVLRSRLYEQEQEKVRSEEAAMRKNQVGSGDRSEKIRTYNFPQSRVSDHRINLTIYQLESILDGDIDPILEPLLTAMQMEALQQASVVKS
jgi:peptide chain release factor 1